MSYPFLFQSLSRSPERVGKEVENVERLKDWNGKGAEEKEWAWWSSWFSMKNRYGSWIINRLISLIRRFTINSYRKRKTQAVDCKSWKRMKRSTKRKLNKKQLLLTSSSFPPLSWVFFLTGAVHWLTIRNRKKESACKIETHKDWAVDDQKLIQLLTVSPFFPLVFGQQLFDFWSSVESQHQSSPLNSFSY